jgi:hypothetical protein
MLRKTVFVFVIALFIAIFPVSAQVPDTSFLEAYSRNPLTLAILGVIAISGIFIWKNPGMAKQFKSHESKHQEMDGKLDNISNSMSKLANDVAQIIIENKNQERRILYNTRDALRLTIYSPNVDISDRLVAWYRYSDCKGNGAVEKFVVTELIPGHEDIWNLVQKMEEHKKESVRAAMEELAIANK